MLSLKMGKFRIIEFSILLFKYFLFIQIKQLNGAPFLDSDIAIQSEIIDPANRTIWAMFNLTDSQLNRVKMQINLENKGNGMQSEKNFDTIKEFRIHDIRHRLESALKVGNSEENQDHPLHEMAAYPICTSDSNESSWLHDNNVTIRFSDSLFEPKSDNLNLDSAILRLYKFNPNGTNDPNQNSNSDLDDDDAEGDDGNNDGHSKPKRCADPLLDSQIRVTVSIVQQLRRNKRERKKRICNTIMMNVSKTGWVEIDIKRAIYIWENVERQQHAQQMRQPILVGWLMIEVHDEEERPLKPGLFFQPPKCDQADLAIPWNYYGPHTAMPSSTANEVPRYPRLDVKLIGYASFAPKTYNRQLHDKLRENLRRQLLNLPHTQTEIDNETTLPSSEAVVPTANNMLSSSFTPDLNTQSEEESEEHNHSKRHSSSTEMHKNQQEKNNYHQTSSSQEQKQHLSIEDDEMENSMEYIKRHRRAHNAHVDAQHHHPQQQQQQQHNNNNNHHHHNHQRHHKNRHHLRHHNRDRKYERSQDVI